MARRGANTGAAGRHEVRVGSEGQEFRFTLPDGFGAAPDHGAIHRCCHGALQVDALVLEANHGDSLEQRLRPSHILQLCDQGSCL